MNELKKLGTQNFMGMEIPVIEGGFGKDCRVLTANTIAEIHNQPLKKINQLIKDNIDEFETGVDLLDLKSGYFESTEFLNNFMSKQSIANSNNIFLLSEQGYMLLVGFMKTEKSKEIRKKLRREYFSMRQVINSDEQVKATLLLSIYNGGQDAVLSSKQLTEIEVKEATKPLVAKIEEQKPLVEYCGTVLNKEDLINTTTIAKDLGMTARKLNEILHKNKIIFRDPYGCWHPYAKHHWLIKEGYADYKSYPDEKVKPTLKWTEKGRKWIVENISRWSR